MQKTYLNDGWSLTILGDNVYSIPSQPIETKVPSTVYSTLLDHHLIPDPYYRDNELTATKLMENDFVYETDFSLTEQQRRADRIFLRFDGIDTIADVRLNGRLLGHTDNMNRAWEFDISANVLAAEPGTVFHLSVTLHSPIRYISAENKKNPLEGSCHAMPGFPHIRKAACMFGWDWGPRLPDAGLFRSVSLEAVNTARISQVYLRQQHLAAAQPQPEHSRTPQSVSAVRLTADVEIQWLPEAAPDKMLKAILLVTSPDGEQFFSAESSAADCRNAAPADLLTGLQCDMTCSHVQATLMIDHPQLWWPNGYGSQPLYSVQVLLVPEDETFLHQKHPGAASDVPPTVGNVQDDEEFPSILDTWEGRIGLRTVAVNTDPIPDETRDPHMKDQSPDLDDGANYMLAEGNHTKIIADRQAASIPGRNFALEVNGVQIFAMGADYIPEDNLLTRQSRRRTNLLLSTAQESNMNCIRIWGGGYFPDDDFYDLCDEKGLLIWQDNMFACACYELTEAFERNVAAEIRQNMRRLRHHACIALWCGNNEMEAEYITLEQPRTRKQYYDYIRLYEYIIPKITAEEDPAAFYWPSSPSSGGNFENSNAENVGDTHYWGVWHGSEPFSAYRKHHYRFLSEFGFQSFPALQTIRRFTVPEDRNVFSRVMEMHQRNTAANGKIMNYISQTYLYPRNFDELIYCSQLLQANAIRYGVEHFRRFRGTCMGTIVWQLNDIWPVASWASVDYYGNWKALQYAEKRMFAPVLLSCEEHGEIDQKPYPNTLPVSVDVSADLHVSNETLHPFDGTVHWALRLPDSTLVRSGLFHVSVPPLSGVWLPHLDFNDQDRLSIHLEYWLTKDTRESEEMPESETRISEGTVLFCAPKHYHFLDPKLSVTIEGDTITVSAENYAQGVSVETKDGVLRLDDNFFDMEAGTRTIRIVPDRDFSLMDLSEEEHPARKALRAGEIRVRSVYETADRESE